MNYKIDGKKVLYSALALVEILQGCLHTFADIYDVYLRSTRIWHLSFIPWRLLHTKTLKILHKNWLTLSVVVYSS